MSEQQNSNDNMNTYTNQSNNISDRLGSYGQNNEMGNRIVTHNQNANLHRTPGISNSNSNLGIPRGNENSAVGNDNRLNSMPSLSDKRDRDNANNAEAVKTAANIASKSGHPVAAGIGKGIQAADKLSGGKASEKLGKSLSKANKMVPGGRLAQKLTNKASESGLTKKINQANSKRSSSTGGKAGKVSSSKAGFGSLLSSMAGANSKEKQKQEFDDSNYGGFENFKVAKKTIVKAAMIIAPAMVFIIFVVIILGGGITFLNAVTLGHADDIADSEALDKINELFDAEEKLEDKLEDDNLDENMEDSVSYIYDIFVDDSNSKFKHYEFTTEKTSEIDSSDYENKEASLKDLEEFYPDIKNYMNEDYDQNIVYKFYVKLYNLYNYYYGIGVKLDMPLLMSVLKLQSTDMNEIFESNTAEYDNDAIDKGSDNPDFDIKKDWSSYKSSLLNSSHDMEVLAQGMVKEGNTKSQDGNYVGDIEFMNGGIGDIYYFNQLDYADKPYGSYGTIASHGCGPTSLSIVVSSLLKEVHDPVELTNYVCSIGGCFNEGSSWDSITQTPPHYGLQVNRTTNTQEVISALGTGKSLAIAIMCPGHFTSGGHFIVLTGTNSQGEVTVADPASRDRSTNWNFNIVAEENCGAYWIVSK